MSPIDRVMRFTGPFCLSGGENTHPFIIINDKAFPPLGNNLDVLIATTVSAGRNANGAVVGQKVGRDQYKIDNLMWPHLMAPVWASMLQEFEKFKIYVTFPDMVHNDWIMLWMYPGDRSAKPFPGKISPVTGLPTEYLQCKCNIIDFRIVKGSHADHIGGMTDVVNSFAMHESWQNSNFQIQASSCAPFLYPHGC